MAKWHGSKQVQSSSMNKRAKGLGLLILNTHCAFLLLRVHVLVTGSCKVNLEVFIGQENTTFECMIWVP